MVFTIKVVPVLVHTYFTEGSRRTLKCQQFLCTCTIICLLKWFSKLTSSSITNATNTNSQECCTKVRSISRNSSAESIKKLRYLVVSWMFCKYLQQFHEFCEFHNGRHYSSWTEDSQLYAVSAGESIDAANSRNGGRGME